MAPRYLPEARSRFVMVDGIRTHYLDCGEGPTVLLLHDGGFGAGGELCWYETVPALASRYRVLAPDWLGFGQTDKLHDFVSGRARRLRHMTRLLQTLDVDSAAFVGSSMGATLLLQVAATMEEPWPIAAAVSASGGGFVPLNEARQRSLDFDCTPEAMRAMVATYVHDQRLLDDERLVQARYEAAIQPGAWEAVAAARFRSPVAPVRSEFGNDDVTPYQDIQVPTLLVAGSQDQLREPGYATAVAARIPDAELLVLEACGHLPHIEHPARFNATLLDFLARRWSA